MRSGLGEERGRSFGFGRDDRCRGGRSGHRTRYGIGATRIDRRLCLGLGLAGRIHYVRHVDLDALGLAAVARHIERDAHVACCWIIRGLCWLVARALVGHRDLLSRERRLDALPELLLLEIARTTVGLERVEPVARVPSTNHSAAHLELAELGMKCSNLLL